MRRLLRRFIPDRPLEPATIAIGDQTLSVVFRRHAQARRLIVRLDRSGKAIAVTVPKRASRKEALDFVKLSQAWIAGRLARSPAPVSFADGCLVPLRGIEHRIVAIPARRGLVGSDASALTITVPGDVHHLGRRLRDWLIAEARRDLLAASRHYATAMSAAYKRITVRDQKSLWGSCTADGSLSYSWRLILAPPIVLDYVAAHEVAHLLHMNHGPRFWRLVLTHCPRAGEARSWLKRNGTAIHRYGG